jgi:hypothetical protein
MGLTEKYMDYSIKIMKKMMPTLMGSAFKFIKMLSPGRAFKMFVKGILQNDQVMEPFGNTEIVNLTDEEAVITTKNSLMLKKYRDIIKKAEIKLDLREYFELMNESGRGMAKEFGIDVIPDTTHIEENTITITIKLTD